MRTSDEYDPERGLRRGKGQISGTTITILLIIWIIAAAVFGGIVVYWTQDQHVQLWECKFGDWIHRILGADRDAVTVPPIQARALSFKTIGLAT